MSDKDFLTTAEHQCPLCLAELFGWDELPSEFSCPTCSVDLTTVEVGNETVILVKQV